MGLRPFIKVVISFVCPLPVRLLLSSIVVTFRTTWMGVVVKGSMGLRPSLIWSIREPDVQATLQNFVVCFVQNRRGPGGTFETHSQRDL